MGDLVNSLLNLVVPPTLLLFLFLLYPPFIIYKILVFIFNSIHREDVRNKVVIITGASSGIGEELAYQYGKRGANLVLVARREQRLHEVAHKARSMGSPNVLVIPGDVSKAEDCKRFIEETIAHFGRLDHLVNNAGIGCFCFIEEIEDISQFSQVMDIIGPLPLADTDKCAEAMVKSACRGQRYVTYPTWYNVLFLYRVLVPEFVEWWYGSFLSTKPTLHESHAPSKKSLEEIGGKKFQYPTILHSPGAKSD